MVWIGAVLGFIRVIHRGGVLVGLVLLLAWSSMACAPLSLAARYPHTQRFDVCVLPLKVVVPGVDEWTYDESNELVAENETPRFDAAMQRARRYYRYEPQAPPESVRSLPSPHNELTCPERFSPLPSSKSDVGDLPPGGLYFLEAEELCRLQDDPPPELRIDPRLLGQQVDVHSPIVRLPVAKFAPNCKQLVWDKQVREAKEKAHAIGKRMGQVLGGADAGMKRLIAGTGGAILDEFKRDPAFLDALLAGLAKRLDEIPAPPTYDNNELATIAQTAFEEGYGQGVDRIQLQFTALTATSTLIIFASGNIALALEGAGAKALRAALTRLRSMPMFVPAAAGGGGFFARIPSGTTANAPQLHHAISKPIHVALEDQPGLRGVFKHRDPRFVARAATPADHQGYQGWHRNLDEEIVLYIKEHPGLTPKDFAAYLYKRYQQPDLRTKFPNGLGAE